MEEYTVSACLKRSFPDQHYGDMPMAESSNDQKRQRGVRITSNAYLGNMERKAEIPSWGQEDTDDRNHSMELCDVI